MSSITFSVIDLSCDTPDKTFTPPKISLSAVSVTKVATVRGYPEWPGFESRPPKKFHTLTWDGSSEQQLWVNGVQIGGARYDYSGFDNVDAGGNITNTHTKNAFYQCNGDPFRIYNNIQGNKLESGVDVAYNFRGYYGMEVSHPNLLPTPHILCPSSSIPYSFVSDMAVNGPVDASDLWGGKVYSPGFSGQTNLGITNFEATSNTDAGCNESGTDNRLATIYCPVIGQGYEIIFPLDYWAACQIIYTSNYSATLSNEYTDAEALANAVTSVSTVTIAENNPRTTGFVSRFTTVNFTLLCTDLLDGVNYIVTVDLQDLTSGVPSKKQYAFTGNALGTNAINDFIPTPLPGHLVQVRNPKIFFAP